MEEHRSFGYWLRRRRRALDLTQEALAQQAGCAVATIRKFEADERRPSREMAGRLADVLAVPAAERDAFMRAARSLDPADALAPDTAPLAAPPSAAPAGADTLTFLFTDIEGSTRLWELHPGAMGAALAHHDQIIRGAVEASGGHVFKTVGDAVCAAFTTGEAAIAAALSAQRALAAADWRGQGLPGGERLRVRMALHSGAAEARDGDYFGPTLNRAARILATGHGGQTLLSLVAAELVRDRLPPGASLRDLGEHRLRDLTRPEQIFQLEAPDLAAAFPPLRSLAALRHNLPVAPTALIGREHELAAVGELLRGDGVRLVTLTGPGGTGKTRLALQAAAEALDAFADGAWFVDLAPVREPALVAPAIAQALGLRQGGQPLDEALRDFLREKRLLLLLDNFEQVLAAAPEIAGLLAAAPGVRALATSRAALHLAGEREYAVPPLSLPEASPLPPLERLSQYEAVRLFVERARAVRGDFAVTSANAPAVAEICHRLDGLPLAIELAAARVRLFAPEALLARLGARLRLLVGGPRDLPARQQTLRGAIEWSHGLLAPAEQALLARLGVFSGGWDLEAAEAVCAELGLDVLGGLELLADQSLVRVGDGPGGEPRFAMLETIREFAVERLEASGEAEAARDAHAAHFLALAEAAEPELRSARSMQWLARLDLEHSNLRAALDRLLALRDYERLARGCYALWRFWFIHGHWGESLRWQEAALDTRQAALTPTLRGRMLLAAGMGHITQSNFAPAHAQFEESIALLEREGDTACLSDAYWGLGHARWGLSDTVGVIAALEQAAALSRAVDDRYRLAVHMSVLGFAVFTSGDTARARALMEESLVIFRAIGVSDQMAWPLSDLGLLEKSEGDYARAEELLQEALTLSRAAGDRFSISSALGYLSQLAFDQGQFARAEAFAVEALTIRRELGDRRGAMAFHSVLAWPILAQGDVARARAVVTGGLQLARDLDYAQGYAWSLVGMGYVALAEGRAERAARLLGAAEALREARAISVWPDEVRDLERIVADTRAALDEATFAAAWAAGRALSLEAALEEALAV